MASPRLIVCPWCGHAAPPAEACPACGGGFDAETRRLTRNAMGPWFVRDPRRPFLPGCSYEALVRRIDRGEIGPTTILRGPTTRQLWAAARRVPSVAHLLGYCHACDAKVPAEADRCPACRAAFLPWLERDRLGLGPVELDADEAPAGDRAAGAPVAAGAIIVRAADGDGGDGRGRGRAAPAAPAAADADADDEAARLAALATRYAAEQPPRAGSGAWTVGLAALILVLLGLVAIPFAPEIAAALRGGGAEVRDLPGGAFRADGEGDDGDAGEAAGPAADGDGGEEAAPGPVGAGAAEAVTGTTEGRPAAAPPPPGANESAADEEAGRLLAIARDPAAPPRERLRAWRGLERRRAAGAPAAGVTAEAVRSGIDRVHLDAWLAGVPAGELDAPSADAAGAGDAGRR